MSKRYMLKEVDASSETGDRIIVEQIFEKTLNPNLINTGMLWAPLFKVVITDKVIPLNDDFTFVHPRTGKLFKLMS
ncbi:hypothetical protein QSV37_12880 [Acinetobacter sp. VNK23]|uniref:Uncharacterized protein n=1 Tax=Acinetobacter corruptisaponis TaxID=3045147 RepID=A0ABY8S4J7_9GAMM|nr:MULTISPECIES: hypothetical protein [Acinetobacter]MDM1021189.1 hypothetical protein [Acinetobacter thutiue]WHP06018.1 hypothetical protein QLH32_00615 [Acinetobacter sp. KCTC 92772]